MSRKIPAKRKKNAKEALRERVGINDGYTFGGNFVNFTTSFLTVGITLFTPIYNLQDLIPQTQETAAVLSGLTRGGGTGGPDYTVLDGDFLHTSSKSDICDSDNWRLAPGASSALVTYASSSPTGSSYQLEFIPTGTKSANITFGRFDAYEITFGEDSFRHLSLKNLQTKKLVTL